MINFDRGVYLKPLTHENAEIYRSARNDYSTWKWCRQHDLISESQQARWMRKQDEDPSILMYEIAPEGYKDDAAGVCGLTDVDHFNQRAEFSLYIMPAWRNRGFAKKALMTLLDHGFYNLNLNMIWGETFEGNPAGKMFEDIGFMKTGHRPDFYYKWGKFIDAHFYCILREQWLQVQ